MSYNWEKIFKQKTDKELLEIYSGNSHLNFEALVYAGLELRSRKYYFDKIREIHQKILDSIRRDIEEFEGLSFRNSKFFRNEIISVLSFFGIVIIVLNSDQIEFKYTNSKSIELLIYAIVLVIGIFTSKWSYNRFKRKKEKGIKERLELFKKLASK